ncbi:MAG TPA: arylsulfatase [Pirellulaceae bacterium]|jgi:arylsulfatase|nr:arylsulfatase [Pirellulaceae bacterium]
MIQRMHLPFARAFAAAALFAFVAAASAAERPNVVLIMSDDMGWSDLGCYGGEIATPTLDSLAANGLRFTQFYNTGRCCPTRASLLTGLYPHQAGVGHMTSRQGNLPGYQGELNRNCRTIAEILRPAGYSTYAVGKWHVARDTQPEGPKHDWPLQRGFDRFYGTITGAGDFYDPGTLTRGNQMISPFADEEYQPETYYYTDAISDHAVRFVREHSETKTDEPFFLYVAYTAAHWPMHALPEDIAKYEGRYDEGYGAIRAERLRRAKELGLLPEETTLSRQVGDWEKVRDQEWEAACMEVYAAMVDRMDQGIEEIVEELRRTGKLENTLVLFLQDNGGCQEGIGRNPAEAKANLAAYDAIPPEALREAVQPKQTRDGRPVRRGPGVMPGPGDTYIAYGENWANVSNTPFREYKHYVHEGGIATPLIAYWPAGVAKRGSIETQPGHLIDVMATCIDLAGATYPEDVEGQPIVPFEGVSLAPAFTGESLDRKQPLFWEHEGNHAIREGNWKLVAKENGPWELYDLSQDRTETRDLAAKMPEKVAELAAEWDAWAARANVLPLGGWRGHATADGERFSEKTRFELGGDADLPRAEAPNVAKRGFTVRVKIAEPGTEGVLVAQGGSAHGWAVRVQDREVGLYVRRHGGMNSVAFGPVELKKNSLVEVALGNDGEAAITVDGKRYGSASVGLVESMPVDGLQVGRDEGGTVGEHDGPFPFDGKIESVTIELMKPR